jgi:hypothetical protein
MGYPDNEENQIKYIFDLGRKHGLFMADVRNLLSPPAAP